jgi:hypothetical protein
MSKAMAVPFVGQFPPGDDAPQQSAELCALMIMTVNNSYAAALLPERCQDRQDAWTIGCSPGAGALSSPVRFAMRSGTLSGFGGTCMAPRVNTRSVR